MGQEIQVSAIKMKSYTQSGLNIAASENKLVAHESIYVRDLFKIAVAISENEYIYPEITTDQIPWEDKPQQVISVRTSKEVGVHTNIIKVSLYCDTPDAVIYYTLDGSIPTTNSQTFEAPITISETTEIKTIAVKEGLLNSEISNFEYIIMYVDIFQFGGRVATKTFRNDITRYNTTSKSRMVLSTVLSESTSSKACVNSTDNIYAAGGRRANGGAQHSNRIEKFSCSNLTILTLADTLASTKGDMAYTSNLDVGVIFGGLSNTTRLNIIEEMDYLTDTFSPVSGQLCIYHRLGGVCIGDSEKATVFNGINSAGGYINTSEVYDYTTRTHSTNSLSTSYTMAYVASFNKDMGGFLLGGYNGTVIYDIIQSVDTLNNTVTLLSISLQDGAYNCGYSHDIRYGVLFAGSISSNLYTNRIRQFDMNEFVISTSEMSLANNITEGSASKSGGII